MQEHLQIIRHPPNLSKIYCNNCSKQGHIYNQCKMPILSIGTIVFKEVPMKDNPDKKDIKFLMIRRNHTFGFMDFIRGKYSIHNRNFILNLFKEMTVQEKQLILESDFSILWKYLWNNMSIQSQYKLEETNSEEKFNSLKQGILYYGGVYSIETLLADCNYPQYRWVEQEWGFPKGRRNNYERDFDCALREFQEETGYSRNSLKNVENIMPYEEIFTGSNYKSYKNKYYLLKMFAETPQTVENFDKNEVSKMEWKTYEECIECIRPYNLEKKQLITNVYKALQNYKLTL